MPVIMRATKTEIGMEIDEQLRSGNGPEKSLISVRKSE